MEPQPPPRFGVLGPVQIAAPDGWVSPPRGKPTLLLAILLAHRDVSLSQDRLIDALWGDEPPRTAATALHGYVSRLRSLIEPLRRGGWQHLVRDELGYRLVYEPGDTDADRFEAGIGMAWSALGDRDLYRARDRLAEALAMWRGQAFEGHADHPDIQAEATRLDDLRRTAQEEEVGARIDTGEHHPMVDRARELVHTHPFRERRWGLLMTALYRSGRQAEALETFRTASAFLGEELGIEPSPRLVRLEERILLQDPTLLTVNPLPVDAALPPHDPVLIGRDDDVERIVGLLSTQRMVSIVGVGGVGKSRVAAAVAHALRDRRENVWFADLGDLVGDGGVPGLVLNTLGDTEPGEASVLLATALRQYSGVLVLDNCEHVLAGVAGIARHAGSARLRLLTASRIPIGVAGESPYELHALSLPESPSLEEVTGSGAGRLLLERCEVGGMRIEVNTETAPLLARLSVLTGGLPLAIELASGLLLNIPLHVVVEHLEHGPGFLDLATADSPRGSVTERLNWSLATLDDQQRLVLAGIATFRGGATIEALHAVLTVAGIEPGDVDVAVWHLARRSLVRFDPAQGGRYWMLEPIRQLAEAAAPEVADRLGSSHYAYFRSMLTDSRAQMESGAQRLWYERIGAEFANLRAMIGHGIDVGDATVIDTTPALADFSHHRGRAREGLALLENMIDRFGLGGGSASTMLCC
ncbi:MAG: winged helix-turn-helix domain-containing protein, partial [Actinomycetota bacterium]|nr:winged helix-turn-helix domain-containing protein [Actinomycetota bacterium]